MPRKNEWASPSTPLSIEKDGVTHTGKYQAERNMVRVEYASASKVTQIGGSPPQSIAKMLLSELVKEAAVTSSANPHKPARRRASRQEKVLERAVALMGGIEASPGETAASYFRRMAGEHPDKFTEVLADLFFPEPTATRGKHG